MCFEHEWLVHGRACVKTIGLVLFSSSRFECECACASACAQLRIVLILPQDNYEILSDFQL